MGLYEEQPWLLVPTVLAIVVTYDVAKHLVLDAIRRRRDTARSRTARD